MKKNPTFGEFIRLTRKEKRRLPLVGLAQMLGISAAQLQRIEEDQVRIYPDEKFLDKLSKSLGLNYEVLVDLLYHHKSRQEPDCANLQSIPVIPWDFLANIENINPQLIASRRITLECSSHDEAVAVTCLRSEWQPFIMKYDVLVVLTTTQPREGDTIISIDHDGECEFRKVVLIDDTLVGFPAFSVVEEVAPIGLEDLGRVVGVVDQVVRRMRRH